MTCCRVGGRYKLEGNGMIDDLKKILEEERIRCKFAGCEFDSDYVAGQIYIYMRQHYKFERK